ncbi:response regulator receiver domain-containing protein [Orenia metallireducens]|uniref:Stage 0 sporulation protein A homolog n=1 Tax=Orenia metallireducens TaxID=1413210 RepID=A0A285GTV8_9FIRM|nr:response regulator receiver domain-containing protein [Orenia metallireducens]SNY27080.1 Response regulator receiver domain-containing protein [Orenia metallireducens]
MNKILVVEDSKNIVTVLKICLTNAGYEVKVVSDGVDAVDTAFEWEPDLILLDIKIPKMNGFLVCETLKKDESTAQIPILMMSAKAEEEDIKKAYDLGADDYIIKPVEPNKLLEKIASYL